MTHKKIIINVIWVIIIIFVCLGLNGGGGSSADAAGFDWPELTVLQNSYDQSWFDDFQQIAGIDRWTGSATVTTKCSNDDPNSNMALAVDEGAKFIFELEQATISDNAASWSGKASEVKAYVNNQLTFKKFVALGDVFGILGSKQPVPAKRVSTIKGNEIIRDSYKEGIPVFISMNAKLHHYQLILPSLTVKTTETGPDPEIPNKDNTVESHYTVSLPDIKRDSRPLPGKPGDAINESDKGPVYINRPTSLTCTGGVSWQIDPGPSSRYQTIVEATSDDLTKQCPGFKDCEPVNNSLALRIIDQQITEVIAHANVRAQLLKDGKPVTKGEKLLRLWRNWDASLDPKTLERNSDYSVGWGFMEDTQMKFDDGQQIKSDIPGVGSAAKPTGKYLITLQEFVIGPDRPIPGDAMYFIVTTEMTPTKYRVRIFFPETVPAKVWNAFLKYRQNTKKFPKPRRTEQNYSQPKIDYGWNDYKQYTDMLPKQ